MVAELKKLDKSDLVALAKGRTPSYAIMDMPILKKYGQFYGGVDRWVWHYGIEKASIDELIEIINICKNSEK